MASGSLDNIILLPGEYSKCETDTLSWLLYHTLAKRNKP